MSSNYLTLCALAALIGLAAGRMDYCSTNTFNSNSSVLQFTKEAISVEYAIENSFKSIHCCGKGYRSIEWFKDSAPYPWASGVSNLILYPEAANQTLYTQHAGSIDRGNYTCRMRNETHHTDHTVRLHVVEVPPDTPKPTFTPSDQWVEEGAEVRLYCEAFVGRINLADAHSDIKWRRIQFNLDNVTDKKDQPPLNYKEIKTTRENEDIVGAYLHIEFMKPEDYGQYVCSVRSNDVLMEMPVTLHFKASAAGEGAARAPGWRSLALGAALLAAALLSAAVLYARCWPRLVLAARIAHARRTTAHFPDKEYDVVVVCTSVDAELTRGVLLPTLALKYHYRLHHLLLTTEPDTWYSQVVESAKCSRSLVCVVSPAQYSPAQLLAALQQLRALPLPPVIVLLQDLPKLKREAKDSRGENLVSLLRRTRLVPWRHLQDRAFWTSLRLALPLPRPPAAPRTPRTPATQASPSSVSLVEMPDNQRSFRCSSRDALV